MTSKIIHFPKAIDVIEDVLNDIDGIINMCLWRVESSTHDDFGQARGDYCTMFYLLRDKVKECHSAHTRIFHDEQRRSQREKRS